MLLFSSRTFTVDGITVFPDHADPNQFWFLPGPVGLETQAGSTEPQFLMIDYVPGAAGPGINGTGFLECTTSLVVSDETQSGIIGKIRTDFPDVAEPRLAPVPFDEGTVQIIALDLQGSGGTNGTAPGGGQGQAVERILGTSHPELFGNNDAVFGLTLSAEGATILEQAFEDGMTPVGAIYDMKFTGVLPALDVKITCDLKRAYDSFSVDVTAQAYFVSAGIDATFEKLRQDGSIKIEVVSLSDDATTAAQETMAIALFKDQILSTWFTPSLSPTTEAAADAASVNTGAKTTGTSTTTTTSGGSSTTNGTAGKNAMGGSSGNAAPANGQVKTASPKTQSMGGAPVTVSPPGGSTLTTIPSIPPAIATQTAPTTTTSTAPKTANTQTTSNAPAGANPLAKAAGTAAGASSAASPFGLSLRLKFVSQDELKTVEYEFSQMNAVQRTYSPQGYFGLLLANVDKSKHFLKVDGNDPFFNEFSVTVDPPKDFATIGLQTAHVAIDYGNAANPASVKHGEYIFDAQHETPQVWNVFQGMIQQTDYNYTADYAFDPESGWVGEKLEYQLPVVNTENKLLTLDPNDFLGFLKIAVSPAKIDPTIVDRIEVPITYTAASGWQTSDTVIVKPGVATQFVQLRLGDWDPRSYAYAFNCYLKDGTLLAGPPLTATASALMVNDPFLGAIDLMFQPTFDTTLYGMAIVEVTYQDTTKPYAFQTSFEMLAGAAVVPLRIPILDRAQNSYRYRITLLSRTNQKTQGAYVTAQDPLVLVGP